MSLRYDKIKGHRNNFVQLTGVSIEEFARIVKLVKPLWELNIESKKQYQGRASHLKTSEDKLRLSILT